MLWLTTPPMVQKFGYFCLDYIIILFFLSFVVVRLLNNQFILAQNDIQIISII